MPQRLHLEVRGIVQGVGFRPFIYNLATQLELVGWVRNSYQGVVIEVEGTRKALKTFLQRIEQDKPPHAMLQTVEVDWLPPVGYVTFDIRPSKASKTTAKSALILPDLATCPDCLRELFDPTNRRDRYPFTNCTHCGPRFSILEALPYDRPNTTMRSFQMCTACQGEYNNPLDRRFHAQPNACPHCGPHLELWNADGKVLASHDEAIQQTAEAIRQGKIVAIKGLGGFHLVVDARNEASVKILRERKRRPHKPLALMYPTLDAIEEHCQVSEVEKQLLCSSQAPIVLLHRLPSHHSTSHIAPSVAPGNPYLGVMLPYTPLHHLLLTELGFPIVATSGNLTSEPICIDSHEALQRLSNIADVFLVHNRPIARPVDDSIVRVIQGQISILRRARGYAPLPLTRLTQRKQGSSFTLLAVGGHLKNTVALLCEQQIFTSQHLGDLDNPQTVQRFEEAIAHLLSLYDTQPLAIACDAHPDYHSSHFAQSHCTETNTILPIQHHYAHVLSCMVDNHLEPPVLGIAWDGTGYGLDGTIWGGEFLTIPTQPKTIDGFERVAYLRPFPLPGGEQAVKEPRRSALGLLYECFGEAALSMTYLPPLQTFSASELKVLRTMLQRGFNVPKTTSAGRLFDAIASLLGLSQFVTFEGQAAMELEFLVDGIVTDEIYPLPLGHTLDWSSLLNAILTDLDIGVSKRIIAAKFHNTMVEGMVSIAKQQAIQQVVLTGGCFQNRYLLERAIHRLRTAGFSPYWHHQIPTNDGGIAIGQVMGALYHLAF
ncbi:MAG: carbamoyltransferase HypF [Scytonema sp. PMC 1069.18]|nr:carbamoyltransferase HypF [Scytonema sp. PMC 1069.18]MEC4887201.1 carbamoyltransferase HypF [Scytonema sp. PMC 1070.18]